MSKTNNEPGFDWLTKNSRIFLAAGYIAEGVTAEERIREIADKIKEIFDMRPAAIEKRLKLRNPIYAETAAYGHMGRQNKIVKKTFSQPNGESITLDVELFTWEKLDYVDTIKEAFGL